MADQAPSHVTGPSPPFASARRTRRSYLRRRWQLDPGAARESIKETHQRPLPGLTGTRNAVQLFARLYRRETGTLLEALSAALTPDADLGIDARVEAAEGDFVRFLFEVCIGLKSRSRMLPQCLRYRGPGIAPESAPAAADIWCCRRAMLQEGLLPFDRKGASVGSSQTCLLWFPQP